MAPDLSKLEQILAIARTGNFTRAATELRITQPALSRNVAIIEKRYGVKIFERGRGGAKPTPLGRRVIEQAAHLVAQATIMEKNIQLLGHGDGGQISLGIGPQLAGMIVPRLGVRLLGSRSRVRLQYTLKTVDLMLPRLRDGEMDMIFCAIRNVPPSSDLAMVPLGQLELAVLARASHPLSAHKRITMKDLSAFPLAVESGRLPPSFPAYSGGLSCENSHLLREIVLASDAVWFSSPNFVAQDIAEGRMIELDVEDLPFRDVEIGMVRLSRREVSPIMEEIQLYVQKLLKV